MGQLGELEIDQHEAAQQPVVKHQIDIDVITVRRESALAPTEQDPLPSSSRTKRRTQRKCARHRPNQCGAAVAFVWAEPVAVGAAGGGDAGAGALAGAGDGAGPGGGSVGSQIESGTSRLPAVTLPAPL